MKTFGIQWPKDVTVLGWNLLHLSLKNDYSGKLGLWSQVGDITRFELIVKPYFGHSKDNSNERCMYLYWYTRVPFKVSSTYTASQMTGQYTARKETRPYNQWQENVEIVLTSNNNLTVAIVQGTTLGKKDELIKKMINNITEWTGITFTWTHTLACSRSIYR